MGVSNFEELAKHRGHNVQVVVYGKATEDDVWNAAIECFTCMEVLIDFDNDFETKGEADGAVRDWRKSSGV